MYYAGFSRSIDSQNMPVFGIVTTVVLTAAVIVFLINLNQAVDLAQKQLLNFHNFLAKDIEYLQSWVIGYSIGATIIMCIGMVALYIEFTVGNARHRDLTQDETCCVGFLASLVVSDLKTYIP